MSARLFCPGNAPLELPAEEASFDRTVTAASRVSADKCQVSYRVITYDIVCTVSRFYLVFVTI